ncbi:hypothetical protein [Paenibacillus xylanexedens]|uniref:hypothetical protein n=1 Tax=Paenibacillus xylanexedens TaxID=528191 RepID=UPI0028EB8DFB|nr:hypothetical protein [Paenibacillus xylanexedens]
MLKNNDVQISKKDFTKLGVDQKVKQLKSFLPSFLTDNSKNIYKLLSIGIHLLSEEDCEQMFSVLKTAILIIFKEKQADIKEQELKIRTNKDLNNFGTYISAKSKSEELE